MLNINRPGILATALVLAAATCDADSALTRTDRQEGIAYLEQTRDDVQKLTRGLSEKQARFKPAPDRWSVAEIVEHIAVTDTFILDTVKNKVMQGPPPPTGRDVKQVDGMVKTAIADRTNKVKAPEPVVPGGNQSLREATEKFKANRGQVIHFLKTTEGLRDHSMESPLKQPLDAYQWLLFTGAHSERHAAQIREVLADPNFPRN